MIANYHTHTARCKHAVGTDREFVLSAMKGGFKVLGFADHTPFPFEGGYFSHIRMDSGEIGDYAGSVLALREEFAGKIEIPLGVEIEYFPQFWNEQLSMLRDAGIEYLLLGQHWAVYAEDAHYSGKATDREDLLERYCRSVRDAMQTGALTYIAHPDLFNFVGDENVYREHMRGLCQDAKSCDLPLEINLVGVRLGRNYPDRRFWELAGEMGCQAILGCDAHYPNGMNELAAEQGGLALVHDLGLELLETVPLKRF